MSAGSKRQLADGDSETAVKSKKLKVDAENANGSVVAAEERKKKKKDKDGKKEKRDKKDKKEKREKKEKKDKTEVSGPVDEDTPMEEPIVETNGNDATEEPKKKKSKKSKKPKGDVEDISPVADANATSAEGPIVESGSDNANGDVDGKKKSKKSKKSKDTTETNGAAAETEEPSGSRKDKTPHVYKQTAALTAVPEAEVEEFLTSQEVSIPKADRSSSLRPILQFAQLPTTTLLEKKPFTSFKNPTPIQSASWPYSLSGRDVIGIAETGSGKTLAFSLPCVEKLFSLPKPSTTNKKRQDRNDTVHARAVIVSPTRELAMQTHATICPLAALVGMTAVCVYGGAPKEEQRDLLRRKKGTDIIVATPGRLKDFLSDGTVSLSQVRFAVLDEADRMLDKGFEEDIKMILGECPSKEQRQTLMFTATWPASVRVLAESFMVNPIKITIGGRTKAIDGEGGEDDGTVELQANSRIAQSVEVVEPRNKEWRLFQLLKEAQAGKAKNDRVLVFCLYKKEAVRVETFLQNKGVSVASIHGDLRQEQRTRSLEAFKAGTTTVLVATDVAARGLDIPEVKLVINVTFPLTIEDYVHRIGRTGRAGKTGQAITLFTEHDKAHSGALINVLRGANQPVPEDLLKFGTTVKKKTHDTYGAFFKDVDMNKKGTKITFD